MLISMVERRRGSHSDWCVWLPWHMPRLYFSWGLSHRWAGILLLLLLITRLITEQSALLVCSGFTQLITLIIQLQQ